MYFEIMIFCKFVHFDILKKRLLQIFVFFFAISVGTSFPNCLLMIQTSSTVFDVAFSGFRVFLSNNELVTVCYQNFLSPLIYPRLFVVVVENLPYD